MRQYRLIYDPPMPGARNMAVDAAIMGAVAAGNTPPTLRLYRWSPPCLSLGYGQSVKDADQERIAAAGWEIVRRPTGGRAILHTDELTYSIALPADHPLAQGSVVASYRRISRALLTALQTLGLQPQADKQSSDTRDGGPVCFETPSHYEITADGRKLIGSAQVRRRGGILQHGSLPLHGDIARICDALTFADKEARHRAREQVRARAITLESALGGERRSWDEVAQAVAAGFASTFDLVLEPGALSTDEQAEVNRLEREVYAVPSWTARR